MKRSVWAAGGRARLVTSRWGWLAAALALGAASAPQRALAFPNAPAVLKEYILFTKPSLTTAPSIIDETLCHYPGSMFGEGFKRLRPFGAAVRVETGPPTINSLDNIAFREAFEVLDAAFVDTDDDGTPDFDEIRAGIDPDESKREELAGTPPPEPAPAPAPETDEGDEADAGTEGDDVAAPQPARAADTGGCAVSSTGRPLDLSALLLASVVALPLVRRTLRPRQRAKGDRPAG